MLLLLNVLKKHILLFLLILGFNIGQLKACSCEFLTIKEAVNVIPLIFKGKVVSVEKVPLSETFDLDSICNLENRLKKNKAEWFTNRDMIYRVQFEDCVFFKGENEFEFSTIYTPINSSGCGYNFLEDKTYIVYADYTNFFSNLLALNDIWDIKPNPTRQWTHLCMRNTDEVEEEERKIKEEMKERNSFFQKMFEQFRKGMGH